MKIERRPRLLFLSPTFPLPLDRGQRVRVHNLLTACCRDFDVTFVSPPSDAEADLPVIEHPGLVILTTGNVRVMPGAKDLIRLSLEAREIMTPRRVADMEPYRVILKSLKLDEYDLIFVERGHLSVLAAGFYDRTIVDLDDLEHIRLFREMKNGMPFLQAARNLPRLIRLFSRETWGLRRFRAAIVCSDIDRRRLNVFGARNVIVVPNGADIPVAAGAETHPSMDAVFFGNCKYPPNAEAIGQLRSTIIPDVRRSHPGFTVDIIGPHSEAFDARYEGLCGRGFIPDLYAELSRYKMLVAPLHTGGGTKLKIIDAMAAGVPLVTTSVGAEGLGLVHGENALIADDPRAIADHVRSILDDEEKRKQLAASARAHVERHFSWATVRADLAEALRELAHSGA